MNQVLRSSLSRVAIILAVLTVGFGSVGASSADDYPSACKTQVKAFTKADKLLTTLSKKRDAAQRRLDTLALSEASAQAAADAKVEAIESEQKSQCGKFEGVIGNILTGGVRNLLKKCTTKYKIKKAKARAKANGIRAKYAGKKRTLQTAFDRAEGRVNTQAKVLADAKNDLDACVAAQSPTPTPTATM